MKKSLRRDLLLSLAMAVTVISTGLAYHQCAYGDWTCAFKQCVHVGNVKP